MKKYILALFFCNLIFAQKPSGGDVLFTFGADYREAEVTFTDGHKEKGLIYGFIENKFIEIGNPMSFGFDTLESRMNLLDNSFDFKINEGDKPRKLTQNEINDVEIIKRDGKNLHYRLMDLKTVNVKGEIVDLKKRAWLPVYSEDKVNLFAYSVYSEGRYMMTVAYLNHSKDNFAINPIDLNRLNLFNIGKIDDKFINALKEVFKDCPEYVKKLEQNFNEKKMGYSAESYDELKKQLKEVKKDKNLTKQQKRDLEDELQQKYYLDPYSNLIEEYNETCPN